MSSTRRDFFSNTIKATIGLSASSAALPFVAFDNKKEIAKTKKIPTLNGMVDSDQLGTTLMHEHLYSTHGKIPPEKEREIIDFIVAMVRDAERVGVQTFVDLSPTRNIDFYLKIAKQVKMNIIVATGAYMEHRMPEWLVKMSEKEFKEHMRREITDGIKDSGIRPGIIKVAGNRTPLSEWEKEKFRAAAQLQKEFDVPIGTHAIFAPGVQFDWLVKNGANPDRLFFSHIEAEFGWGGQSKEQIAQELLRIAKGGGSLLFNNFGYEFDTPWEDLVYLIRFLCDKGYEHKVMTSMDTYLYWNNDKVMINVEDKHPESRNKTYAYAITDAVPAMLKSGISAKEINSFLVKNPQRYFS